METQNLWPDFVIDQTRSPKAILKEQAGYLMAKTNNVLSAEVETSQSQDRIVHMFYVIAPAMDNYRYKLFTVSHGVIYYPLTVEWEDYQSRWKEMTIGEPAQNQEEFLTILGKVFNDRGITRIISSLLSQSLAE